MDFSDAIQVPPAAAVKEGKGGLYLDLIKAHRSVIITGPAGGVVSSY